MDADGDPGLARVPSGIAGLDTILGGGFFKGGLYIIQGAPGAGKTIFGNQVCFNHAGHGARALYVTLLTEYHARMMQHLSVMSFFEAARIPDQFAYINGLKTLHDKGLDGLLAMLRREITARGASIMVLDGIVSAQSIAGDGQAFNHFLHNLQAVAIAAGCTFLMLTSAPDAEIAPEQTMVDGIIELAGQPVGWSTESVLRVVKFRGSAFLRGQHAFKITNDGIVVHPRIEALLARPSRQDHGSTGRVTSGLDQLDRMLEGGLPGASTTIVMGPSGSGKTTLGLQFLSRSTAEEPGLLFGFYETLRRIDAKIMEVCPSLRPLVNDGVVAMQWQPPTDDLLDAYGERLLRAVHQRGVRRLLIDGLGALHFAAGANANRMGNFLTALINELRVLGVTTLCTLEGPDLLGPMVPTPLGDLASLAENLILLRYVEAGSRLHRLISILKVRDSRFDSSLHEYATTSHGLLIEAMSESAERILTGCNPAGADLRAAAPVQAGQSG